MTSTVIDNEPMRAVTALVPVRHALTNATFLGAWTSVDGRLWVAGQDGVVQQLDGNSSVIEPTPVSATLTGIWGLGAVPLFASGAGGTILRRESGRWTKEAIPSSEVLLDVWGLDPNNALGRGQRRYHPALRRCLVAATVNAATRGVVERLGELPAVARRGRAERGDTGVLRGRTVVAGHVTHNEWLV